MQNLSLKENFTQLIKNIEYSLEPFLSHTILFKFDNNSFNDDLHDLVARTLNIDNYYELDEENDDEADLIEKFDELLEECREEAIAQNSNDIDLFDYISVQANDTLAMNISDNYKRLTALFSDDTLKEKLLIVKNDFLDISSFIDKINYILKILAINKQNNDSLSDLGEFDDILSLDVEEINSTVKISGTFNFDPLFDAFRKAYIYADKIPN